MPLPRMKFDDYDRNNSAIDPTSGVYLWDEQVTWKKRDHGNYVTPTPYSLTRTSVRGAVGGSTLVDMYYYRDFSGPGWYYGGQYTGFWEYPFSPPTEEPPVEVVDMFNRSKPIAALALLEQVGKELPDFDLLTEVAELKSTYSFFRDTVERLYRFGTAVYARKPLAALHALGIYSPSKKDLRWTKKRILRIARHNGTVQDACSDIWLKYRYALMPTLYSGNDALFALAGFQNDIIPSRSQVTIPDHGYVVDPGADTVMTFPGDGVLGRVKRVNQFDTSTRVYGFWVGLKDIVSSIRGTRLLDFAQTAWELVPFSFVVDWFWNLSAYLSAQRIESRVTWAGCAYALKANWIQNVSAEFWVKPNTANRHYSGGFVGRKHTSLTSKTFFFKREPISSPANSLQFPDISVDMNWRRYLDAASFGCLALKGRLKQHMTL